MTVLINQYSASAAEIFSGGMKDLHRALIVGHRSFGKGSVQNLIPIGGDVLNPKAFIKLTTSYYYLPNGESLHRRDGSTKWGVDPDVAVDLTPKQLNDLLTERRDNDIIHRGPATSPATTTAAQDDTQLDTALLMMRLQLVQSHA
jgi:carboxyl-terminal processing protease